MPGRISPKENLPSLPVTTVPKVPETVTPDIGEEPSITIPESEIGFTVAEKGTVVFSRRTPVEFCAWKVVEPEKATS